MFEFIRNNWLIATITTIFISGLLWAPGFLGYDHADLSFWIPCTGELYEGDLFNTTGYRILTICMALLNGFALQVLCMRYLPMAKSNYILLLFYVLIIFASPQARAFSAAFPAALLIIFGLYALCRAGERKDREAPLFITSFFAACSCLLYLPAWPVLLSFGLGAIILRVFSGRGVLIFLGGLLFPIGSCLLYRYLLYDDLADFFSIIGDYLSDVHFQFVPRSPANLFLAIIFVYMIGRSITRLLKRSSGDNALRSRILIFFVWMLIICVAPLILYADGVFASLPILAVPASVIIAYYFTEDYITRRMKVEFGVLLLAVALNQVAYFM